RARDTRHAVETLTCVVAAEADLDHEAVCREVLDRAETSTFGFGRGVAIPHAAIRDLRRPIGAFARLDPGHAFGADDDAPADLVFLLLSPSGDDPTHLRSLACVARRLRD